MTKLLKETGIAIAVYFLLSFAFGFGMDEGDGWPEAALSALVFGIFYFVIGLIINWIKGRNS